MKYQSKVKVACCSTRQKVYGIIALVGLFACGVMIGVTINGGNGGRRVKEMGMTESQCQELANEILRTSRSNGAGGIVSGIGAGVGGMPVCTGDGCVAKLRELNEVYTKHCAGRVFEVEEPKPASKPEDATDKKTCEVIEGLLERDLADENDNYPGNHQNNINVYKKLAERGCPENVEKYQALIQREQEILMALTGKVASDDTKTCSEIERLLTEQVRWYANDGNSEDHIQRAKIYANLFERGCPENRSDYLVLAEKELEIARALQDDDFSDSDRAQISDTYKRIQMKQAAGEILNKVQKLTDPAIDFIIQAQKIIEE